jgi:hypothetical protein
MQLLLLFSVDVISISLISGLNPVHSFYKAVVSSGLNPLFCFIHRQILPQRKPAIVAIIETMVDNVMSKTCRTHTEDSNIYPERSNILKDPGIWETYTFFLR